MEMHEIYSFQEGERNKILKIVEFHKMLFWY